MLDVSSTVQNVFRSFTGVAAVSGWVEFFLPYLRLSYLQYVMSVADVLLINVAWRNLPTSFNIRTMQCIFHSSQL